MSTIPTVSTQAIKILIYRSNGRAEVVRLWNKKSVAQASGQSSRTQCCQRLATAATFLRKKLCCLQATTRRWASPTRYTIRRKTANIIKRMICFGSLLFSVRVWTYMTEISSFALITRIF